MENEDVQTEESSTSVQDSNPTLPLLITIIGIFCYIGVILPSVFESSTSFINYSTFDILLMVGGAVLVGLGSYFLFKTKTKVLKENEDTAIDLV